MACREVLAAAVMLLLNSRLKGSVKVTASQDGRNIVKMIVPRVCIFLKVLHLIGTFISELWFPTCLFN
jgi:hypothetical protein